MSRGKLSACYFCNIPVVSIFTGRRHHPAFPRIAGIKRGDEANVFSAGNLDVWGEWSAVRPLLSAGLTIAVTGDIPEFSANQIPLTEI